ncbi:hypothetical protein J3A83DRAFT_4093112, partial [Scleroderma citrinum]
YAFFSSSPTIEYIGGCCSHVFKCTAKGCRKSIHQFLDKGDAHSTRSMHKHVKACWGEDVLHQVFELGNVKTAHETVNTYAVNGSITMAFEQKNKIKMQYSHQPHTRWQTRAKIVRWVAESTHPFNIIDDAGFQCLMKTGRPNCYLPNLSTVLCDIQNTFVQVHQKIAKKLQVYGGELNFATDTHSGFPLVRKQLPNHSM